MAELPRNGSSPFRPWTTPHGQSTDEAVLELDEPAAHRRPLDPLFCFRHAVHYPFSRPPGPQEGRLLAAMAAREPLESRLRAAPDNSDVTDGLRPGWDDPACRDYLVRQLRAGGLAGRQARAPSHGASWARLPEGLPCRRCRCRCRPRDYGPLMRTMAM